MRTYICVLWMFLVGYMEAKLYGSCTVYEGIDVVPQATEVSTVCVKKMNSTYCKFVPNSCPEVTCAEPRESADGRCILCPGMECVYDGNALSINETFDAIDEVNTCTCMARGRVKCTKEALPPPADFCF